MPTKTANRSSAPAGWRRGETAARRIEQPARGAARSYNAKERTVEAVLATGYRVRRWYGFEELAIHENAVDLTRVALGQVRFIDSHNASERAAVLGTLIEARVEKGLLLGTIKFHNTEQGRAAEKDAAEGNLTGLSVGYRVNKLQLVESDGDGESEVYRAVSWELLEVSSVSVPADPHAAMRSVDLNHEPPLEEETIMEPATSRGPAERAPTDRARIDVEIRQLSRLGRLDDSFTNDLIARGLTLEEARTAMLNEVAERSQVGMGDGSSPNNAGLGFGRSSGDDPAVLRDRMAEALAHRLNPALPLGDAARQYRGMRLVDCARVQLQSRGERLSQFASPTEILRRAHTISDFPMLLAATGNRVLMAGYEAAASPLKALARRAEIADFRAKSSLRLGAMGRLEKVAENGEVTHTTRGEAKESYKLETFGRLFSLTRQAIINDDLGAFGDFNVAAGQAAAQTEASELVALLTANGGAGVTMEDQQPLFHTTHGNLAGSGAAIDVTTLGAGRQAMRGQVGIGGELINVAPAFVLVGAAQETAAEQVLATLYAATVAEANPFSGKLTLLVEPRLSGNQWFLFADPARAAVLEFAYLSGQPGPQIATREGWDVLGMEFRVVLDFGCGVLDHRGAYRNAGA